MIGFGKNISKNQYTIVSCALLLHWYFCRADGWQAAQRYVRPAPCALRWIRRHRERRDGTPRRDAEGDASQCRLGTSWRLRTRRRSTGTPSLRSASKCADESELNPRHRLSSNNHISVHIVPVGLTEFSYPATPGASSR